MVMGRARLAAGATALVFVLLFSATSFYALIVLQNDSMSLNSNAKKHACLTANWFIWLRDLTRGESKVRACDRPQFLLYGTVGYVVLGAAQPVIPAKVAELVFDQLQTGLPACPIEKAYGAGAPSTAVGGSVRH